MLVWELGKTYKARLEMVSFVILWFVYPYQESLCVNMKGMDLTQISLEKTREVKVISIGLLIMKEKKIEC